MAWYQQPGQAQASASNSACQWNAGRAAEMRSWLALKMEAQLPSLGSFVMDDTGFTKKMTHRVGVARQYSGAMGEP